MKTTSKPSKSRILRVWIEHKVDTDPDTSYLEQEGFEERKRQYLADLFGFLGIIAKCEVQSGDSSTIQTLRSGGLWGVESDSDKSYLAEVATEELSSLRSELESFGFSKRQIDYAFRNVETVNR